VCSSLLQTIITSRKFSCKKVSARSVPNWTGNWRHVTMNVWVSPEISGGWWNVTEWENKF
jgi:hypothetical protein